MTSIRVMLIEDARLVRLGLVALLSTAPDIEVVGAVRHAKNAVQLAKTLQPDVILLDAARKGKVDIVPDLKGCCAACRIIVLTTRAELDDLQYALQVGVQGYLLKDGVGTDLLAAVRRVSEGKTIFHPILEQWLPQMT